MGVLQSKISTSLRLQQSQIGPILLHLTLGLLLSEFVVLVIGSLVCSQIQVWGHIYSGVTSKLAAANLWPDMRSARRCPKSVLSTFRHKRQDLRLVCACYRGFQRCPFPPHLSALSNFDWVVDLCYFGGNSQSSLIVV